MGAPGGGQKEQAQEQALVLQQKNPSHLLSTLHSTRPVESEVLKAGGMPEGHLTTLKQNKDHSQNLNRGW